MSNALIYNIIILICSEMKEKESNKDRNWAIDGSLLTLYNVKKGIHGNGDNAVYQCKAENKHGYVWANFYLNLLGFFFLLFKLTSSSIFYYWISGLQIFGLFIFLIM